MTFLQPTKIKVGSAGTKFYCLRDLFFTLKNYEL